MVSRLGSAAGREMTSQAQKVKRRARDRRMIESRRWVEGCRGMRVLEEDEEGDEEGDEEREGEGEGNVSLGKGGQGHFNPAPRRMKLLDRYVLRSFLEPFMMAFFGFLAIWVIID